MFYLLVLLLMEDGLQGRIVLFRLQAKRRNCAISRHQKWDYVSQYCLYHMGSLDAMKIEKNQTYHGIRLVDQV